MKKLLIVDDEEDILMVLKSYLSAKGYDVKTTLTCEHALEVFYIFKPDLVLLDVNVGKSDGRVMCKMIKAQAAYQHVPVILMSADLNNLLSYSDYGAISIMEKPFNLPLVLATIRSLLNPQ